MTGVLLTKPEFTSPAVVLELSDKVQTALESWLAVAPHGDVLKLVAMAMGYGIGNAAENTPDMHRKAVDDAVNALRYSAEQARAFRIDGSGL